MSSPGPPRADGKANMPSSPPNMPSTPPNYGSESDDPFKSPQSSSHKKQNAALMPISSEEFVKTPQHSDGVFSSPSLLVASQSPTLNASLAIPESLTSDCKEWNDPSSTVVRRPRAGREELDMKTPPPRMRMGEIIAGHSSSHSRESLEYTWSSPRRGEDDDYQEGKDMVSSDMVGSSCPASQDIAASQDYSPVSGSDEDGGIFLDTELNDSMAQDKLEKDGSKDSASLTALCEDEYDYSHDDINDVVKAPGKNATPLHHPRLVASCLATKRKAIPDEMERLHIHLRELEVEIEEERLEVATKEREEMGIKNSLAEMKESGIAVPMTDGNGAVDSDALNGMVTSLEVQEDEQVQLPDTLPKDTLSLVSESPLPSTSTPAPRSAPRARAGLLDLTFPLTGSSIVGDFNDSCAIKKPSSSNTITNLNDENTTPKHCSSIDFMLNPAVEETPYYFKKMKNKFKSKENTLLKSRRNAFLPDEIAQMAKDAGPVHRGLTEGHNVRPGKQEKQNENEDEELEKYRALDLAPMDTVIGDEIAGDLIVGGMPTPVKVRDWMNREGKRMEAIDLLQDEDLGLDKHDHEDETIRNCRSAAPSPSESIASSEEETEETDEKTMDETKTKNVTRADEMPNQNKEDEEMHNNPSHSSSPNNPLLIPIPPILPNPTQTPSNKHLIIYQSHPLFITIIGMLPATIFWSVAASASRVSGWAYHKAMGLVLKDDGVKKGDTEGGA